MQRDNRQTEVGDHFIRTLGVMKRRENMKVARWTLLKNHETMERAQSLRYRFEVAHCNQRAIEYSSTSLVCISINGDSKISIFWQKSGHLGENLKADS